MIIYLSKIKAANVSSSLFIKVKNIEYIIN
ncbi:hypothetical protein BPSP16_06105 [Brachyspira pilosicoli SP16]|nr:hypothetical protein BPSP16_06105 [Brachyspira pilosicoli SP16]